MLFKRLSLAVLVAAASQAAMASPDTSAIQFQGAVKGTTCTVSVGGVDSSTPSTVVLDDFDVGYDDGNWSQLWSWGASFAIDLKGCSGPATQVRASFQGGNGTTVTDGMLNNMATDNPAKGIRLLLNTTDYLRITVGGDQSTLPYASIKDGAASMGYIIRYYADKAIDGGVTAGNIEAAVEYTIAYQ